MVFNSKSAYGCENVPNVFRGWVPRSSVFSGKFCILWQYDRVTTLASLMTLADYTGHMITTQLDRMSKNSTLTKKIGAYFLKEIKNVFLFCHFLCKDTSHLCAEYIFVDSESRLVEN